MRIRLGCILAAAVTAVALVIPAGAAEASGEVRVTLDFGDGEVHDGEVTLYRVAGREGQDYRLTQTFGGGLVKWEDAVSDALALWLSQTAGDTGKPRILDADGTAWFTGLPEGLYLLVQSEQSLGLDPFAPLLFPIPSGGQWQLVAYPQTRRINAQVPQTGQPCAPFLAAMTMVLSGLALLACAERFRRK